MDESRVVYGSVVSPVSIYIYKLYMYKQYQHMYPGITWATYNAGIIVQSKTNSMLIPMGVHIPDDLPGVVLDAFLG